MTDCPVLLAEWNTHRQLALDLNQPAELRQYHRKAAAAVLVNLALDDLRQTSDWANGILAIPVDKIPRGCDSGG